MTITRALIAGAVLAGAAIGLAGPASADPLSGDYTSSLTDAGPTIAVRPGNASTVIFSPCGADCTHYDNTVSLDNNTLIEKALAAMVA
jgi:hypothetical protein